MADDKVALLNRGYDAFGKGDLDTLRELFTDDIVFHVSGESQIAGDYRGQEDVFGFFGKLAELSGGSFRIERHAILADEEHGAVLSTVSAQRDGKQLRSNAVDVHHFDGDRIREVWTVILDQKAANEFWG
jgi:ketosteroid isomerase-like protein